MIVRSGRWALPLLTSVMLCSLAGLANADVRVPTHVACVGDSITEGFAASNPATKSYPAQLQVLFGAQVSVKNFGRTGTTMLSQGFGDNPYENTFDYQNATNFVKATPANAVVDVIIMLGANDSKPSNWTPPGKPKNDQQYLIDYRAMVEHFLALTPKPEIFLALPLSTGTSPCCTIDGKVIHDEELPLIRQLAKEKSLPIIDLNTPTAGHPEYLTDGVHPNDGGYLVVAKLMHDGLLQDLSSTSDGGAGSGGSAGSGGAPGSGGSAGRGSAGSGGSAGSAGSGGAARSGGSAGSGGAARGAGGRGAGAGGGSSGRGGTAGNAVNVGAGGASGGENGGAGGVPAVSSDDPSDSSSCSMSRSHQPGRFPAVLSLSVLLALIGVRSRPGLARGCDRKEPS